MESAGPPAMIKTPPPDPSTRNYGLAARADLPKPLPRPRTNPMQTQLLTLPGSGTQIVFISR